MVEIVHLKLRPHEPIANSSDGRRFHDGVFLGIDRRTGLYIVYDNNERIKYARTILRVPDAETWNREMVQKVGVTPMSLHHPREPEVVFREAA